MDSNLEKPIQKQPVIDDDFYEMMKVKPKPKTTTNYRFKPSADTSKSYSVNVKLIDKTQEELVDPILFLSKLNIGVINKGDKIVPGIEKARIDPVEMFDEKHSKDDIKKDTAPSEFDNQYHNN